MPQSAYGGQSAKFMSQFSLPTFTWDPGIELKLSGLCSKGFYPLSHLTAFFFFNVYVCALFVQYLKRSDSRRHQYL